MTKFRKKPVEIEAWQFLRGDDIDFEDGPDWFRNGVRDGVVIPGFDGDPFLTIKTLEGDHRANVYDWIIRGVEGELYPCKPSIFAATYEPST